MADGNSQRLAALRAAAGETLMVMVAGEGPGGLTIRWTPEWENDRLAGRAELGQEITANGDVVFSAEAQTHGAASGPEDAQLSGTNRTGHSRWWTWRPLVNGIATILAQVDTTAHVELFEVLPAGNLRKISYRQTAYMPGFRCHVESGREYAIAVDGVDGSDARFSLWVRLTPDGPPPGNDLFARANILEGLRLRVAGSHRAATRETGEPGFDAQPARRSLWWRWRAPQTGSVTVRAYPESQVIGESLDQYPSGTAASPTAPRLAVLQGASWDDLDWAPQAGPSQALRPLERAIRFRAEAGTTYRIVVDASDNSPNEVGEFALELIVGANGDSLADAQVVTGENPLLTGTLEGATPDGWRPNGGSPANIWWLWTAPRDLRVTLHARDVGWAVFDSPSGVPLVTSFGSSGAAVRRDFLASAGRTYWMSAYGSPGRPLLVELDALPVPANDAFDGRLPLTGDRVRVAMRAENASQEAGEPNHGTLNRPSLWWSWKAPRSGDFLVTTGWEPQAAVSDPWDQVARAECFVYAGDNLSALTLVGDSSPFLPVSSLQPRRAVFTAVAGQTYQIAACPNLEGQRLWSEFAYEVRLAIDALPDNRTPESAIELAGPAASWQGVVRPGSEGLWWRWTAPASGRVVMGGGPPGFEAEGQLRPAIQVFRREGAGTLARLESDGLGAGRWEGMALAGETWWIQVLQAPNPFLPPPPWELAFDLSLALERSWGDNDAFAARTRLGGARPVIFGSNEDAGGPALGGVAGGGSQWWEWTVPETGRWYVSVVQPWDLELPIEVYRGSTLATLASVPRDPGMLLGSFSFYATAGEVLPIAVGRRGIPIRFEVHLRRLPPPPNDEFGRATELPSDAEGFTTVGMGATTEPGEPGHGTGRAKGSRWWSWTAPVTALMAVRISGEVIWNPPAVAVYRGDLLNQLISVGGNGEGGNPAREFAFAAEAGVTYRLAVDTPYPDDPRSYYLALEPVSGPENDSFTARISLTGARVQTVGFNGAATLEVGEPQAGQTATAATLWWSWTAPASGTTTIHTGGSEMDTGLAVFGGGQWPQLTPVAVNDDAPDQLFGIPAGFSRVSFVAQAGVTYAIQVGSVGGGRGQLRLSIVGPELPGPVVSGIEPSAGVGRLRLRGRAGQSVRILVSEDLHTWREAGRVQFVGAEDVTWQDPGEPSEVRFYQLVVGN